jgi:hypothetical protein
MAKTAKVSMGLILMYIAVAIYLFATGIIDLAGNRFSGGEIRQGVHAIFKGDLANIVVIVLAVLAIIAGVFMLLKIFGIAIPSIDLILVILAIAWLVFIILFDFIDSLFKPDFLPWLKTFGAHLMGLGGILLATGKFK